MTRQISVTFSIKINSAFTEQFLSGLANLNKETLSFPGCISIRPLLQTGDANSVLFIEEWESIEDFDCYMLWRTERGDIDNLAHVLSEAPQILTWKAARV